MIVATAGHVDHGKTSLVRALTGIDTDRLPEEKARGMTIDLGFAYRHLDGGGLLGFVDVPGHERFVRNMVAGVCGVDHALLVVAADDGPMPQTLEHVDILDLIGVTAGTVAITKIDRVSAPRRREVDTAIAELLSGSPLAGAPVFATSAVTGEGIAALGDHLAAVARQHCRRAASGRFRFAVDRCFVLRGVGVIATGPVFNGTVRVGDSLAVSPSRHAVRVRGLRIHDRDVEIVQAGDRCAMILAGIERAELRRGDWLVPADACPPTRRLDVRLRVLPQGAKLRHWTPAHLHLGAAEVPCRVGLARGQTADFATLVLDRPIGAIAGDRFVLRDQSAQRTIGGGTVLDPLAPERVADKPARRAWLTALEATGAAAAFAGLLEIADNGVDLDWFANIWNLTVEEERRLVAQTGAVLCEGDGKRAVFAADAWRALLDRLVATLDRHHHEHPDLLGFTSAQLSSAFAAPFAFRPALAQLIAQGIVERNGSWLHLSTHRPVPTVEELRLWRLIEPALIDGGIRPPRVVELAALTGLERGAIESFLLRADELGWVQRVARNRFFLPAAVQSLGRIAETLAAHAPDGGFSAADFNGATGIGRNLTIEVLEHLDRVGITRRVRDRRQLGPTSIVSTNVAPDRSTGGGSGGASGSDPFFRQA